MNAPAKTMDFEASGFFALRTPLLPFEEFERWNSELESAKALAESADLERSIANDRSRLRARLLEIFRRPEVREALFVASPNLDESFEIWIREPESDRGKGIELALVRYFARMAGRATPFGLFAGCSVGTIGAQTRLALTDRNRYQRHTRLDMDYLYPLCEAMARDPALRPLLTYRPNTSLYRATGRVRYAESRLDDKKRSYHLVAVDETEALNQTIARAESGARVAELANALVDDEISPTEAEGYIDELIESQILIPDLLPGVTGPEPLAPLIDQLEKQTDAAQPAIVLRQVHDELSALDAVGLGQAPERYRAMGRALETLPGTVDLPRLFQVDMVKPAPAATLGKAVLDEIVRGVKLLHRLSPLSRHGNADNLKAFREAFMARYESREVPLIEALDAEMGIGIPIANESADVSPLLCGLEFPVASESTAPWGTREKFLLQKLGDALQNGVHEIVLQESDLEKLSPKDPRPAPDAFSVIAAVAAASDDALAHGDFRLCLQGASGPSGARFLGRFCHADEALHREVERHLRAEEALHPDAIFAEVAHLAEGRLGNILARPVMRDYEIPYLARSSVPPERQIPVTDLLVAVRDGRIVLRSARLDREVIPRLTSAHNFHWRALGIYQFLGMLQGQGVAQELGWSWGPLESASFLPRLASGRLVLSRARWRLQKEELKQLAQSHGVDRFRAADALRKARRLPRLVLLADGDNALPIDFENVLSVETFVTLIKNREEIILTEMFPAPDQLCARGPEGRFVHELIIPFVRKLEKREPQSADFGITQNAQERCSRPAVSGRNASEHGDTAPWLQRTFPPGSDWLYAKLYCGTAGADHLLRDVVRPITAEALRSGAAGQWFFIRYSDPDFHLRLRFHGNPERLHSDLVPAVQAAAAPFLDEGRIWRLQFDTYEREVERYGGADGMVLAERLFHTDSEAVLKIIERLDAGDPGLDERWRLTLCGIDLLLHDFGFDAQTKLAVMRKVRTIFAQEFRVDRHLKSQIGERFRKDRKDLEALLDQNRDAESTLAPGFEILGGRAARLAPIVAELKGLRAAGRLSVPPDKLATSYIHMHVNRMLRSAQRAHELVLYEFLTRLYESHTARRREGPRRDPQSLSER